MLPLAIFHSNQSSNIFLTNKGGSGLLYISLMPLYSTSCRQMGAVFAVHATTLQVRWGTGYWLLYWSP